MKHTPGPWKCELSEEAGVIVAEGMSIATAWPASLRGVSLPAEANARLIAKSPELLAKLQEIWDWADDRADINWNDQPNNAMEVKSMIGDLIREFAEASHV